MSQGDKSALYKALTQAGWKPEKHYREYSTADLESIANQMLGEAVRTKPADPEPKGPIRQEQPRSPHVAAFLDPHACRVVEPHRTHQQQGIGRVPDAVEGERGDHEVGENPPSQAEPEEQTMPWRSRSSSTDSPLMPGSTNEA